MQPCSFCFTIFLGDVTTKPLVNPMRMSLEDIMENDTTLQLNYERLVELCQIHKCLHRYCLKEIKPQKDEKAKSKKDEKAKSKTDTDLGKEHLVKGKNEEDKDAYYVCRFDYPKPLYGFEATYYSTTDPTCQKITAINKTPGKTLRGAHCDPVKKSRQHVGNLDMSGGQHVINYVRNHPTINNHVKEFLVIWLANTDTKPIYDVDQVIKYLFNYVCKHEKESLAFRKAGKAAVANISETTSVKTGLQKIFIKSVGKDTPLQEAHIHLNKRRHHAVMDATFHQCSVGGGKSLNLESDKDDVKVVRSEGYPEKYWNRENDQNYLNMCLKYDAFKAEGQEEEYFKLFHPNWKTPKAPQDCCLHDFIQWHDKNWRPTPYTERIPIISPYFQKVPSTAKKERYEVWARTSLLEFKVGATPDNLLNEHDTISEAFEEFMKNVPPRLKFLHEKYQDAQIKGAIETAQKNAAQEEEDAEEEEEEVQNEVHEEDEEAPFEFEDLLIQPNGKFYLLKLFPLIFNSLCQNSQPGTRACSQPGYSSVP